MKKIFVALSALMVAACAKPYVGVPYTAPAQPISSIGIVDDSLADEAEAREAASVVGNFGLLGAIVDSVDQNNRKNQVNDALRTIDYNAEANFEKLMIEALARQDVKALVLGTGEREDREFLETYPAQASVQVMLDMNVQYYGYANPGGTNWRPTVYADVRLVDPMTKRILMENRIAYNPLGEEEGIITIAPDAEYAFDTRDQMTADPQRLAAGIDAALREVVATVVRLMQ